MVCKQILEMKGRGIFMKNETTSKLWYAYQEKRQGMWITTINLFKVGSPELSSQQFLVFRFCYVKFVFSFGADDSGFFLWYWI